ncbi:dioxygenase [Pseudorhodobacter aquimaris]|uniref:dioxygenase n=1 Tax=Pseudorhodobacter aquimaris TaxID=687412 RepID=UPI000AB2CB1F|nr:dioxygenase [Pseudorhodobacter aquimaris]
MRNVTADNITEVFAAYFGPQTDPRTREVLVAMARHLHDFAREVNLTHDEWRKGLAMLEHAGRITTPERNEFVLFRMCWGCRRWWI